jgi:hypothetical protein
MRDKKYLERLRQLNRLKYELFYDRTRQNTRWVNPAYAGQPLPQILEDCRQRYREKVGQAPQEEDRVRTITDQKTGMKKTVTTAGWSPIREGVCPVKDDTKIQDFEPAIAWLQSHGVKVISIDIHRDEGYLDPVTKERKYNLHAHIICDWTNHATGKTAKLSSKDMSEFQTVLADALGMERGVPKEETGADHLTPAQYREKAAAEHTLELEARVKELEGQITQLHTSAIATVKGLQAESRATIQEYDKVLAKAAEIDIILPPEITRTRNVLEEYNAVDFDKQEATVAIRFISPFQRGITILSNTTTQISKALREVAQKGLENVKKELAQVSAQVKAQNVWKSLKRGLKAVVGLPVTQQVKELREGRKSAEEWQELRGRVELAEQMAINAEARRQDAFAAARSHGIELDETKILKNIGQQLHDVPYIKNMTPTHEVYLLEGKIIHAKCGHSGQTHEIKFNRLENHLEFRVDNIHTKDKVGWSPNTEEAWQRHTAELARQRQNNTRRPMGQNQEMNKDTGIKHSR